MSAPVLCIVPLDARVCRKSRANGQARCCSGAEETRKTIGDENNTGALLDKAPGTIEPLAYVRGLCRLALAAGVRGFTESEGIAVSGTGSPWRNGAATGSENAEWVIIATDAYGKGPWSQI